VVEEVGEGVETPEVTLQGLGSLRGSLETARDGSTPYFQFLGIPYAAPPVGPLRWKAPAPVSPWDGVRDATLHPDLCLQKPYEKPKALEGSEDCLYLNVYTRSLSPGAKKPVVVWLHGGAFIFGGWKDVKEGGAFFMEEDVVLVLPQYRLGAFGWLSTEDKEAPGNYGLLDQLEVLKWVQAHIEKFGGDPGKVTLGGLSAGAASTNYLMLSPRSDGLFHRAVALSGSALAWWANVPHPRATAFSLGEKLGCSSESSSNLLECLRQTDATKLMKAQDSLYSWQNGEIEREPMNIWSPRQDLEAGEAAVLPIPAHTAMEVGQIQPVPFLVGVAAYEGTWRASSLLRHDHVMLDFIKNFNELAPHALGLKGQVKEGQMDAVIKKVKDYYLSALTKEKDLKIRLERVITGIVNMLGDTMFNYPIDRMVKLHGNKPFSPTWMYQFNYKHGHSLAVLDPKNGPELDALKRPGHGHELFMMFPVAELSKDEVKMSRKYIKLLVEFAEKGHPKHDGKWEYKEWEPIADGQITHFVFGKYSMSQVGFPFQHRMKWWNELPAFWKKDSVSSLEVEPQEDESIKRYAERAEEISEESVERYAEGVQEISEESVEPVVEELTKEELEELEIANVVEQLKDEL